MNIKIQKKAQKAFVTNPDSIAIINAGDYIVISSGSIGVHISKNEALIAYDNRIAVDRETGELHEDASSFPDNLKKSSYAAVLTNRLGYTEEHKIARKLVAVIPEKHEELTAYVLLEDLKFFGAGVGYRIARDRVVVTEAGTQNVIGMIVPQNVNEEEIIEEYE